MKNKRFTAGILTLLVLLALFLVLAACQNEEQLDQAVAILEATAQPAEDEEPTLEATEVPPTPEPTPVPPTPVTRMPQGRSRPGSAGSGSATPASRATGVRLRSLPPSTVTKLGQKPFTHE